MIILDGQKIKEKILNGLRDEVNNLPSKPSFVVIQIGNDLRDNIYIREKKKMALSVGYHIDIIKFDEMAHEEEIITKIKELNNDNSINGIIVEFPLPKRFDTTKIINAISPKKDIDGITYMKYLGSKKFCFVPATALGIMEILKEYRIEIKDKNVVVIGKSNLVGKPVAKLLMDELANVTVCDSKTKNISDITKNADILVVAVGKANLIKKEMIKQGSVIIDVGINYVNGILCGDVDIANVSDKCSYITPVPGGVGPMTVAMLAKNIYCAYNLQRGR